VELQSASVYDLLDASLAACTLLAAKSVLEGEAAPIRRLTVEVSHTLDDAGWSAQLSLRERARQRVHEE